MKISLRLATALTWFNLLVWGPFVLLMALAALVARYIPFLIIPVLFSSIPLNCYAALQLQKSIRRPVIRLSSQTPTGIRFVGFVALFFAINFVMDGFSILGNPQSFLKIFKEQQITQVKGADLSFLTIGTVRGIAGVAAFLGICIGANVILNFRLLRWYYLVKQSDVDSTGPGDGR